MKKNRNFVPKFITKRISLKIQHQHDYTLVEDSFRDYSKLFGLKIVY